MQRYKAYKPTGFDQAGLNLPDRQEWLVVPVGRNRDSAPYQESNFETALQLLGGESDTVEIHRFGHWACGWLEILLCAPEREADAQKIADRLDVYPILDENDLSEREMTFASESWEARGARDFVRALVAAFELSEATADFLAGLEADALHTLHYTHAPQDFECTGEEIRFDFRYLETREEPSRDTLARFIREQRAK